MKRTLAIAALSLSIGAAASAAGMALIYDNDEAVTAGRSWPALVVEGGAAMPSDAALSSANTILYGDAEGLFRGSVARLDNDLNMAIVRRGERVGDDSLQSAHANRWRASSAFLRVSTAAPVFSGGVENVTVAPVPGEYPLTVKINGIEAGSVPIVLHERFKKSKFRLEVVNTSTMSFWNVGVKLTAQPSLSFWKEGRKTGLNDVPTKTFDYVHQAVFKPLKPGTAFHVPVEVYFIKERDYVWDITLESKGVKRQTKALVRFE
jgi:hypothetical protein